MLGALALWALLASALTPGPDAVALYVTRIAYRRQMARDAQINSATRLMHTQLCDALAKEMSAALGNFSDVNRQ